MKKAIYIIIFLLVVAAATALTFNKTKMQDYLDSKFTKEKINVIGEADKYNIESKHIATEIEIDGIKYNHFMS